MVIQCTISQSPWPLLATAIINDESRPRRRHAIYHATMAKISAARLHPVDTPSCTFMAPLNGWSTVDEFSARCPLASSTIVAVGSVEEDLLVDVDERVTTTTAGFDVVDDDDDVDDVLELEEDVDDVRDDVVVVSDGSEAVLVTVVVAMPPSVPVIVEVTTTTSVLSLVRLRVLLDSHDDDDDELVSLDVLVLLAVAVAVGNGMVTDTPPSHGPFTQLPLPQYMLPSPHHPQRLQQ